eukprot:8914162-Pyramimonas_sp.AAC.1
MPEDLPQCLEPKWLRILEASWVSWGPLGPSGGRLGRLGPSSGLRPIPPLCPSRYRAWVVG